MIDLAERVWKELAHDVGHGLTWTFPRRVGRCGCGMCTAYTEAWYFTKHKIRLPR